MLQQSGSGVDDPEGVVFPNPTLVEEVVLEKLEVGLAWIGGRVELGIGWEAEGGLHNLAHE